MHPHRGLLCAFCLFVSFGLCLGGPECLDKDMHYSVFLPADRCAHALHYPKVALLFLTMGEMPHEPLWRLWFEELGNLVYRGCDPDAVEASEDCKNAAQRIGAQRDGHPIASQQLFNVYVHLPPEVEHFKWKSMFRGYEINHRADSWWLYSSAAMYALLHTAYYNPANKFFVFLSESCVPLYPASLVYLQIIHSTKSRLNPGCADATDFGKHARRPTRRALAVEDTRPEWRKVKSAQWVLLMRRHAAIVSENPRDSLLWMKDEVYVASLLHTLGLENETTCEWQGPTYAEWLNPGDYHPAAFEQVNATLWERARAGSVFANVTCDWEAAMASAGGQFARLDGPTWRRNPPFAQLADTCPLFIRKVTQHATADAASLLWPARAAGSRVALQKTGQA